VLTIILSRGNVFVLAGLYAFGVIWSFAFKALAVLILRHTHREPRQWKVPGNLRLRGTEVPIGLALITLLLFLTAVVNFFTKPEATVAGIIFSAAFFGVFTTSERLTARHARGQQNQHEQFRVYSNPEINSEMLQVRPGNILVAIRDPHNLSYLRQVLSVTDTTRQDVVVMTARVYPREHSFGGSRSLDARAMFDDYEQALFTAVVGVAEKEGKTVSLLVAAGSDVFDVILLTAQSLRSSVIVCGVSNRLLPDQQAKLTGDAWERLPEPRQGMKLEVIGASGETWSYNLGPHSPRLREEDLELLHNLWLQLSANPELHTLHHYHVIALALSELSRKLGGPHREEALRQLEEQMHDTSTHAGSHRLLNGGA
jgi:hypothetical protein